jgi:multidrug resistance protein, MATE family
VTYSYICGVKTINREILRLSIPNILSNIVIPLAGMVDVAIMGHLNSSLYIGAVALGAMIFNFIYWGFGFLRMSTTGFTAQAYGSGSQEEIMGVFTRAGILALAVAILLLLFQQPIGWLSFELIKGSADVEQHAFEYFSVRIWAAPATLMLYVFYGWFIGMQNSIIPASIAIAVSLVNAAVSYLLVFRFGMKADGVALGTVIAQYTGLVIASVLFLKRYRKVLHLPALNRVMNRKAIRSMMGVNRDIFIRTMCLIAVMTFFTARSARYGTDLLAANTLLFQFFIFFSYFIDGFAYAGEALTGKFIGLRDPQRLKRLLKTLFLWGAVISIAFTLVYGLLGNQLPGILTNDPATILATKPLLFWTFMIPVVSFAAFLWDGIYIGATAGAPMRNVMLVASGLVFFPAYFLLDPLIGNHALWLAMLLFLGARSIGMSLFAHHLFKRLQGVE